MGGGAVARDVLADDVVPERGMLLDLLEGWLACCRGILADALLHVPLQPRGGGESFALVGLLADE